MAQGTDRGTLPRRTPWAAVAIVGVGALLVAATIGLMFDAGGTEGRALGLLALVAGAALVASALASHSRSSAR